MGPLQVIVPNAGVGEVGQFLNYDVTADGDPTVSLTLSRKKRCFDARLRRNPTSQRSMSTSLEWHSVRALAQHCSVSSKRSPSQNSATRLGMFYLRENKAAKGRAIVFLGSMGALRTHRSPRRADPINLPSFHQWPSHWQCVWIRAQSGLVL